MRMPRHAGIRASGSAAYHPRELAYRLCPWIAIRLPGDDAGRACSVTLKRGETAETLPRQLPAEVLHHRSEREHNGTGLNLVSRVCDAYVPHQEGRNVQGPSSRQPRDQETHAIEENSAPTVFRIRAAAQTRCGAGQEEVTQGIASHCMTAFEHHLKTFSHVRITMIDTKRSNRIVPVGRGGVVGKAMRIAILFGTAGFVFPNVFLEGMDMTAIHKSYQKDAGH